MSDFYDQMAGLYHLIFADWDASIERQGEQLAAVIRERWGAGVRDVLDVSCGIGTQAIGLARRGFTVTASDLSAGGVARARDEAGRRTVGVDFSVCDMRAAHAHHRREFDVVVSADNSVTHLMTDDDLLLAFRQMYACTRPGGGCLVTVRDYDREEQGTGLVKSYGVREEGGTRYVVFQVWDFLGSAYDLSMYFVEDDRGSGRVPAHVMRTRYNAVGTATCWALCEQPGSRRPSGSTGGSISPSWLPAGASDRTHSSDTPGRGHPAQPFHVERLTPASAAPARPAPRPATAC